MFGTTRLLISDSAALAHMLVHRPYDYVKPAHLRGDLERILGRGAVWAEVRPSARLALER